MRPVLLLSVLLNVILAGCSGVDTSPIDSGIAPGSTSVSARPLPRASGHWSGLAARCPRLTSDEARRLGVGGYGAPTDEYSMSGLVTNADCRWGSGNGTDITVGARISIWPRQEAADAQWQTLSAGRTTPLSAGDEGFIAADADAVVIRTRSSNAIAVVRLVAPTGDTDRLTQLHRAASAITNDVLDDLVSG